MSNNRISSKSDESKIGYSDQTMPRRKSSSLRVNVAVPIRRTNSASRPHISSTRVTKRFTCSDSFRNLPQEDSKGTKREDLSPSSARLSSLKHYQTTKCEGFSPSARVSFTKSHMDSPSEPLSGSILSSRTSSHRLVRIQGNSMSSGSPTKNRDPRKPSYFREKSDSSESSIMRHGFTGPKKRITTIGMRSLSLPYTEDSFSSKCDPPTTQRSLSDSVTLDFSDITPPSKMKRNVKSEHKSDNGPLYRLKNSTSAESLHNIELANSLNRLNIENHTPEIRYHTSLVKSHSQDEISTKTKKNITLKRSKSVTHQFLKGDATKERRRFLGGLRGRTKSEGDGTFSSPSLSRSSWRGFANSVIKGQLKMKKMGQLIKPTSPRVAYFWVNGSSLLYSKNDINQDDPKRIELKKARIKKKIGSETAFLIETNQVNEKKTYVIHATNKSKREEWMNQLILVSNFHEEGSKKKRNMEKLESKKFQGRIVDDEGMAENDEKKL